MPPATAVTIAGLEVHFGPDVLTPRPWTLLQARWAAELLPRLPLGDVLELCAGAGHIGLLAVRGSSRRLIQVDANESACAFARINAARTGILAEVRHARMEEALHGVERFPLVLADPPWVPSHDVRLHPEDPPYAIDGGPSGLTVVRSCLRVIANHLSPAGAALLQLGGPAQVGAVSRYVDRHRRLGLRVIEHRLVPEGAVVLLGRAPAAGRRENASDRGGVRLTAPAQPAPRPRGVPMTTTPQEPVDDGDIETAGAPPAAGEMGLGDADGTDGTTGGDADGTDGGDADGTDGGDADGTDGGDADGTDA